MREAAHDVVDLLRRLIETPSVGGSEAEAEIPRELARTVESLGLTVDLWPLDLPALRAASGYPGEEVERRQAWGLVAFNRPGEDVGLILQGHLDVVPPGDRTRWSADPFTAHLVDGRILGRGACDMKGGVAAILGAVAALGSDVTRVAPFAVHGVIGEEDGGLGAFATLQRGHTGAACVIPEPTGLQLIVANAGSLTFRIEVPGLATHGSTAYAGVSAVDAYLPIHTALTDLAQRRNTEVEPLLAHLPVAYPLSVGRLRAGDWPSSVPDRLVAEGRYGLRIDEDPTVARAELGGGGRRGRGGRGGRPLSSRPSAGGELARRPFPWRSAAPSPPAGRPGPRGAHHGHRDRPRAGTGRTVGQRPAALRRSGHPDPALRPRRRPTRPRTRRIGAGRPGAHRRGRVRTSAARRPRRTRPFPRPSPLPANCPTVADSSQGRGERQRKPGSITSTISARRCGSGQNAASAAFSVSRRRSARP